MIENSWERANVFWIIAKPFQALLLRGYTIAILLPMLQASTCGQVNAPSPLEVLQNSGNWTSKLRGRLHQRRKKSRRRKIRRESAAIYNRVLQCTDWLTTIKPSWLLNQVSIARVVALFPQVSRLLPTTTEADSEMPCVYACQSEVGLWTLQAWGKSTAQRA